KTTCRRTLGCRRHVGEISGVSSLLLTFFVYLFWNRRLSGGPCATVVLECLVLTFTLYAGSDIHPQVFLGIPKRVYQILTVWPKPGSQPIRVVTQCTSTLLRNSAVFDEPSKIFLNHRECEQVTHPCHDLFTIRVFNGLECFGE